MHRFEAFDPLRLNRSSKFAVVGKQFTPAVYSELVVSAWATVPRGEKLHIGSQVPPEIFSITSLSSFSSEAKSKVANVEPK